LGHACNATIEQRPSLCVSGEERQRFIDERWIVRAPGRQECELFLWREVNRRVEE
jgi:hypothetical protein